MVLDQPVVVLGGGGFIGANLCNRLTAMGCDVTAIDVQFPSWRRPDAKCVRADLTDLASTARAMHGAGIVFHLASDMGGVGYFHSDADFKASTDNGRITLNVARVAAETGCRLFYASSACAYPIERQQTPGAPPRLAERDVGHGTPDALYGAEKLHGLRIMAKLPEARVGILHTVFGPLQEHEGRRMKFPAAVATKALAARSTGRLELWGDGTQMRSYLYADDAVDKIIAIATGDDHGPLNVGAEGAVTCRAVAEMCLDIAGADAKITLNPAEPSGVLARDCDNTRYDALYGAASVRPLRESFERFMAWIESL